MKFQNPYGESSTQTQLERCGTIFHMSACQ